MNTYYVIILGIISIISVYTVVLYLDITINSSELIGQAVNTSAEYEFDDGFYQNIQDHITKLFIERDAKSLPFIIDDSGLDKLLKEHPKIQNINDMLFESHFINEFFGSIDKLPLNFETQQLVLHSEPPHYTNIRYNSDHYFLNHPDYIIDKSDYIKHDNAHMYVASNGNLTIFDINPPNQTHIISQTLFSNISDKMDANSIQEMYL